MLRDYLGLSRKEFGVLFRSRETTVCEWENGHCIPRIQKLLNISMYFGVSLDCIVSGRVVNDSKLETMLSQTGNMEAAAESSDSYPGQLVARFHSLPNHHKERLLGYLDALCREQGT